MELRATNSTRRAQAANVAARRLMGSVPRKIALKRRLLIDTAAIRNQPILLKTLCESFSNRHSNGRSSCLPKTRSAGRFLRNFRNDRRHSTSRRSRA